MDPIRFAVIGGGAKAAALAARASVVNSLGGYRPIEVSIFEKSHLGASWTGKGGYTDGRQLLCTPIERDLGYPYPTTPAAVGAEIHKEFSWGAFLLSHSENEFVKWVDAGRRPPTHEMFARYLTWAIKKSGARVVEDEVIGMAPRADGWRIRTRTRSKLDPHIYQSVVITGPGPARRVSHPRRASRIFDGQSMWLTQDKVKRVLRQAGTRRATSRQEAPGPIVILGAGGTAAAILAWLVRSGFEGMEIIIISKQPAFYTRGDSVFENRLFNDESAWASLPLDCKKEFSDRLNRGVVWTTVMDEVAKAIRVTFEFGEARKITAKGGGYVVLVQKDEGTAVEVNAQVVFDAIGFRGEWWLDLVEHSSVRKSDKRWLSERLQAELNPNLSLSSPTWTLPPVYVPTMGSTIGPGIQSLMSLGGMAHRIIHGHLI